MQCMQLNFIKISFNLYWNYIESKRCEVWSVKFILSLLKLGKVIFDWMFYFILHELNLINKRIVLAGICTYFHFPKLIR